MEHVIVGDLRRRREIQIAEVLARYELGELLEVFGLRQLVSTARRIRGRGPKETRPESLRRALEALGPTFIKLGQVLSTRGDLLHPQFRAELAKLQDSTTPLSGEIIEQVLRNELGAATTEVFATFEHQPLAAASIGQVHGAVLHDGTEVVVKVRRPGAAEEVDQDLDILLSLAARASERWKLAEHCDLVGIAKDFGDALRAELDYAQEAGNAQRFAANFAAEGGVHIPTVYPELSTSRVLTLERIKGTKITDLRSIDSAGIDRSDLAERFAGVVAKMMLIDGYYHGDPHPGNFFVEANGRIGIVDFGRAGSIDDERRSSLSQLLTALLHDDPRRLTDVLLAVRATTAPVDRVRLLHDLSELLSRYGGHAIHDVPIGPAISEIMEIVRRHQLFMPSDLALLFAVLVMAESVTEELDPDFRIEHALRPYAERHLASVLSPEALAHQAERLVGDVARMVSELPRQLHRLLEVVGEGRVEFHLRTDELEPLVRRIERLGNRVAVSVLAAALIEGLSELAAHNRRVPGGRKVAVTGALVAGTSAGAYAWRRSRVSDLFANLLLRPSDGRPL